MPEQRAASPAVVVFGASGGIGSELTRRLSAGGGRVLLAARNEDRLKPLAAETGGSVQATDVTQPDQVKACLDRAVEEFGRVDGVAHCVGSVLLKPAHRTTDAEWSDVVALNLTSAFHVVRAAVGVMTSSGGSIVLMSSAAARVGLANHEAIAAAKAGVIGLTLSAAATYASRDIRVNCLAPGLVCTPMTKGITENEVSRKASQAMHPLGRLGEPGDVASLIAWLLGPESGWVTGQVFGVDGGLGTVRSRRPG